MKKTLVSALTGALVIGATATTFAAANPFADVPADHWAYDAVAQLAADGVIEGYGDGTYRGDQEITRYEMAQMVARAMARVGVGDGDKALIDRLAAEFADELNNLGVRVAALEKKVDNVKWEGTVRYRYTSERDYSTPSSRTNNQFVTFRLEPSARINEHWTGHARIDYDTDMNTAANTSAVTVERMWVQGEYGNTSILLGKLPYVTNVDGGMIFDENLSGGQVTFGNNVMLTLTAGRAKQDPTGPAADTASYQSVEVYNDRDQKFTWGLGYHRFLHEDGFTALYGKKEANLFAVGAGLKVSDSVGLVGAYAWNSSPDRAAGIGPKVASAAKRAWTVELDYKGADPADKGSFGLFAGYRHLGRFAVWAPTYDGVGAGQKGWEFGLDYVPFKNVQTTFKYFRGKTLEQYEGQTTNDVSKIFGEINFFF
ncbi:MAG: S-layer homology domain-containing protein [Schwartzia sp. (in: firmicutes)]